MAPQTSRKAEIGFTKKLGILFLIQALAQEAKVSSDSSDPRASKLEFPLFVCPALWREQLFK